MDERCIILDIGGVLEHTPRTGWIPYWERELGLPPGTVDQRLEDVWHAGSIGAVDEAEVRRQVAARLRLDPPRAAAFMADFWAEYLGTPNVELIAHVRGLRHRTRLGILSNSFVGAREREVSRYGFDELVEDAGHIVYSHEIGVEKPDPQAFEKACTILGVRAADCLFVDDHAPNVETALTLGMQAHLFDDNHRTIARIAEFLSTDGEFRN
ncbi:HAD family hydrolase [Kitasatospora sp. NPDC057936]|uniref:HAD family hydrolase n=1 Tax=Kitasatospora sp. NPDC057936 TaxID=3346283 RepID=UPI0036DB50E8